MPASRDHYIEQYSDGYMLCSSNKGVVPTPLAFCSPANVSITNEGQVSDIRVEYNCVDDHRCQHPVLSPLCSYV